MESSGSKRIIFFFDNVKNFSMAFGVQMSKFFGGAVLVLLVVVIVQQLIYGGRVDPDSVALPDTVVVRDTCWLPDTSGWVEGGGTQPVDLDSLAKVWKDAWLAEWLTAHADSGFAADSLAPVLPAQAELASLDTTIEGLCRFQVDYILPPFDLWRVRVSERFEVTKLVTIKAPYPKPVYPKWSIEAMLVGGKLIGEKDKYRVGILGGIFHKRAGLVFGLDTQGYWFGIGYQWRLGKG